MQTIRLTQQLRPMRFLFLVSQNNKGMVERTLRINCALWGGMFNPIVALEHGEQFIASVFEASHSDLVVNFTDQTLPSSILQRYSACLVKSEGYDGLTERNDGKCNFRLGCDIRPLLELYWEREGRIRSTIQGDKEKDDFLLVEGATPRWQDYALVQFGHYPEDFWMDYKNAYSTITSCKQLTVSDENISSICPPEAQTPLDFTLHKTRYHFASRWGHTDRYVLFIGDLDEVHDWLEFWNLRCFGSHAIFVPWDRVSLFSSHLQNLIVSGYHKITGLVENFPLIQKSSKLDAEKFEQSVELIRKTAERNIPVTVRDWLPQFGIAYAPKMRRSHGPPPLEAPIGIAFEQEDLVHLIDDQMEFKTALPEFLIPFRGKSDRSWSIAISGWGNVQNDLWLKLPNFEAVAEMLRANPPHHVQQVPTLCSREPCALRGQYVSVGHCNNTSSTYI